MLICIVYTHQHCCYWSAQGLFLYFSSKQQAQQDIKHTLLISFLCVNISVIIMRVCIVCRCLHCHLQGLHCMYVYTLPTATSFHIPKAQSKQVHQDIRGQSRQNKPMVVFVADNGTLANTDSYSMCKNALQAGRDTRSFVLGGHR